MLACYRGRDWDGALAAIAKSRIADEAGDFAVLYDLYADRIETFRKSPPPEDWNGVVALTTK
jgi:adenylate cyclase